MAPNPRLETTYEVGDGDVSLAVIIGDGQIGTSIVRLDQKEIARGDFEGRPIGAGAELAGKELLIKTVVTDVNESTDHTSVTYMLSGGPREQRFSLHAMVPNAGESIIYRAFFDLTKRA